MRKIPYVLKKPDIDKLFLVVKKSRDRLILKMLTYCGLRVAEFCNLKVKDIDIKNRTLKVVQGKGKKDRFVILPRKIIPPLRRYLKNYEKKLNKMKTGSTDSDLAKSIIYPTSHTKIHQNNATGFFGQQFLFTVQWKNKLKPFSTGGIRKLVKKYAKLSGLNYQEIHPHTLRHSFATHILKTTGNLDIVRKLMGHENLESTSIYLHLDMDHIKEVYDRKVKW